MKKFLSIEVARRPIKQTIGQVIVRKTGMHLAVFVAIFTLGISSVKPANILMVHPAVSKSHELMFFTIGEALANRGHNVTLVRFKGDSRVFSEKIQVITLQVQAKGRTVPYLKENGIIEPPHRLLWSRPRAPHTVPLDIVVPVSIACETILSNETIGMLKSKPPFDIAIVDLLFNSCGLALVHHLGLPTVAYWPTFPSAGETFWTSTFIAPSYFPVILTDYTDRMSFLQRFVNTAYYVGARAFAYFVMVESMVSIIQEYLPNTPHPTVLIHNVSLFLVNSDFTLDFSRPITPNTIHIGCLQCRPAKPLPQDLEEFMQSSGDDGVIVFSLGATFNEGGLPVSVIREIYEAFSRCKQKFILKMSANSPTVPLPSNVRAVDWLPQQDILGHPKTRLFITHCGMHGVLEAIYHAVPMVGIPIFGDQGDVLVRLQLKGVIEGIDKKYLSADNLYEAIQLVINNKRYYENMKQLSERLKDQPQTAMERTMYWIEYIIRHRGAEHLKASDRHLNIIQYLLLDVIALYLLILCGFLFFCKWMLYKLWLSLTCRKPQTKTVGSGKKKKQK